MKKVLCILTAMVLMLNISMTVFAKTNISAGGSDTAEVTATYDAGTGHQKVYSVDITWEGLNFTYNAASEGTWNPESHQYDNAAEAGWAQAQGTITIKNHSNTEITAAASYQAAAEYASAGVQFNKESVTVATADNGVEGGPGTAVEETISVTPTGTLTEGAKNAVIGTITIAIS